MKWSHDDDVREVPEVIRSNLYNEYHIDKPLSVPAVTILVRELVTLTKFNISKYDMLSPYSRGTMRY